MHLKRIAAGYGKQPKFITVPNPGAHPRNESIPLLSLVRDRLGYADTARESNRIIREGHIVVNGTVRKDPKYGVGLMDVIEIPVIQKFFRVLPSKRNLYLKEIDGKESNLRLCRIANKSILPEGKVQLNLHDGTNLLVESGKYKTRDTVMIDTKKGKITQVIEFKEGNTAMVVRGRHSGEVGKIVEILPGTTTRDSLTKVGELQTLTKYLFVIGEDKPTISV